MSASAQAPSSPHRRPRIILSDRGVAIFTGISYLLAAVAASRILSWLARETGQVDGRVAQLSWIFALAMLAFWIRTLVSLYRRRP